MLKRLIPLISLFLLAGCGVFNPEPTITPIYVTATEPIQMVIVTNTPAPAVSPVLAPTVDEPTLNARTTPTAIPTTVITPTPTFTVTPTDTPVTPGAPLYVPVGGVVAEAAVGNCASPPGGGFATIYNGSTTLATQLGCPVGASAVSITTAYQTFERGFMVYVSSVGTSGQRGIYVFYNDSTYQSFADTWNGDVDPISTGLTPPAAGLQEPIRGFGKVWRSSQEVQSKLGWATGNEIGDNNASFIQLFGGGVMIYIPQTGQTYVMVNGTPGTWSALPVPYN